ncbi:MAG TPA: hypothetical protein VG371_06295 [Solirubrobacteraceae bacterium]|nr:hypothetical protein [Solirubrobacteraceae bacterium]
MSSTHLAPQQNTKMDRRPRGHVVGRALGQPLPAAVDGSPRGHIVGHAVGEPLPAAVDGLPRGHMVGRPVGEPLPLVVDRRPGVTWSVARSPGPGHD